MIQSVLLGGCIKQGYQPNEKDVHRRIEVVFITYLIVFAMVEIVLFLLETIISWPVLSAIT